MEALRGDRSRVRMWTCLAGALGSAVLVRLSMPTFDFAWAAFIAWVPLLLLVGRVSARSLFGWAYLQSFLLNLTVHWWLVPALHTVADTHIVTASAALTLVAAAQAARTPLILLAVHWASKHRVPVWASFPVAVPVMESVFPNLFPWTLALEVQAQPIWLQLAALGGTAAVSFWIALINALVAGAWDAARPSVGGIGSWSRTTWKRAVTHLSLAAVVLALVSVYGHFAMVSQDARQRAAPIARVALGHVSSGGRGRERDWIPELREATIAALLSSGRADLVLWPETVVSRRLELARLPGLARDYLLRNRARGRRGGAIGAPLLFGAMVDEHGALFNSAVLIHPSGQYVARYDKSALLPLGESSRPAPWLPFGEGWLPAITRFTPGSGTQTVAVEGHALAVSICYEDILEGPFRESVLTANPELLVNLTSDAWFAGTDAVDFHLALARLRSVEHRKYLVRSTRDGATAVIDGSGRTIEQLDGDRSRTKMVEVRWLAGQTPYCVHGRLWLCVLLSAGIMLGFCRRVVPRS